MLKQPLLSYALLRLGLPIHLVRFMCRWLYTAQYRIKLQDGITAPYRWTPDFPLQGTGQGTGWSPPNWSSISDLITRSMDTHTPGMQLTHPNRTFITRTVDAFVDDTNSGLTQDALNAFSPPELSPVPKHDTIYDQTSANVQFYSDLLTSSGGKWRSIKVMYTFSKPPGAMAHVAWKKPRNIFHPYQSDNKPNNMSSTSYLQNNPVKC